MEWKKWKSFEFLLSVNVWELLCKGYKPDKIEMLSIKNVGMAQKYRYGNFIRPFGGRLALPAQIFLFTCMFIHPHHPSKSELILRWGSVMTVGKLLSVGELQGGENYAWFHVKKSLFWFWRNLLWQSKTINITKSIAYVWKYSYF